MGFQRICDARKRRVYELLGRSTSCSEIRATITKEFGTIHRPISNTAIAAIRTAGDEFGNPCYVPPRRPAAGPKRKSLQPRHRQLIGASLGAQNDALTAELAQQLRAAEPANGRASFPESTINDAVRQAGKTHKRLTYENPRRDAWESAEVRTALQAFDPSELVFVDATHLRADDYRRRAGRSERGTKAVSRSRAMPHGGVLRTAMCALNLDGYVDGACELIEGPVDSERHLRWATERLAPELNAYDPVRPAKNSVVVMDNLNLQHKAELLELFDSIGCKVVWLARYDPRCNPIERGFAQFKAYLRSRGQGGFARAAPEAFIHAALASITAANSRGYFRDAGLLPSVEEDEEARLAGERRAQEELLLLLLLLLEMLLE